MSQHSLYESNWINLVFENRNKEYGAFQLRQETTKTSFHALSIGILLCTALLVLPNLLHLLNPKEIAPPAPDWNEKIIKVDEIFSADKKEAAPAAALPEAKAQKPTELIDSKQLINPVVVNAAQAPDVKFSLEKNNPIESTSNGIATIGSGTTSGEGAVNGTETGLGTDTTGSNGSEVIINEMLDKKPQYPGGIEKFYLYIGNHFNSPTLDENRNVRIFVSFVVEKDGSMSNIKVLNKPGALLEKEAIRVLQSIKAKWTPGIYNSKPVRTAYNLPIVVQVD